MTLVPPMPKMFPNDINRRNTGVARETAAV